MKPLLSICIPTLNRPDYLLQAIHSILHDNSHLNEIEVCISNNCSDSDYSEAERLIAASSKLCAIKYVRQRERLPLDHHHHFVTEMANSEYVYFLGDDDFFLRDQMGLLIPFIVAQKPDLAIFNGFSVDADNRYLGRHFYLESTFYQTIAPAFRQLRDKGSFGAVLVRRDLLLVDTFRKLYGTDHAYCCYWAALFRKHERGERLRVFIPDFPCVALRCASKNYNHIDVYYKKLPYWMTVFRGMLGSGDARQLIDETADLVSKMNSSARFLIDLADLGYDLSRIEGSDPLLFRRYRVKIIVCKYLSSSSVYGLVRRFYRTYLKRSPVRVLDIDRADFNRLISSAAGASRTPCGGRDLNRAKRPV